MAWNDFLKKKDKTNTNTYKSVFFAVNREQYSGEVERKVQRWIREELGEAHPFDAQLAEDLLRKYGMVDGILDRFVNYIWGKGFHVTTTEAGGEKAIKIISDFIRDVKLSTVGRAWIKEALHKPGGYLEIDLQGGKISGLKIRNGKTMYVQRDKHGNVTGYCQYIADTDKPFNAKKKIPLKKEQIIPLHFNVLGDDAYGMGILWPNMSTIDQIVGLEKDMHLLIHRKANAPLHIRLGIEGPNGVEMPTEEDVAAARNELETLTPKTELVTDRGWEANVIDFGKVGEKFKEIYDIDYYKLIAGFKTHEVLLGKGNIAEGLGEVQEQDLALTVESMRELVENGLEDLFDRVLLQNGIKVDVEVVWNPTSRERNERITQILSVMGVVQPAMRFELEKQLANLLEVDEEVLLTPEEQMAERATEAGMMAKAENDAETPEMPPKDNKEEKSVVPKLPSSFNASSANSKPSLQADTAEDSAEEDLLLDVDIKEWVGFNYKEYMDYLLSVVGKDNFDLLRANNELERAAGYLNKKQIEELRKVLTQGFTEGQSIRKVSEAIREKVRPGDLYSTTTDSFLMNEKARSVMMARSETVRLANSATKEFFKDNQVAEYRWIASAGDACPECSELNGTIFSIDSAEQPPAHPNCRCTLGAVIK